MSDLEHIVHSCFILCISYVIMIYVLKQPQIIAERRSIALGAGALAYMLLFGHTLPKL